MRFLFFPAILIFTFGCSTPKSAMDDSSVGNTQIPISFSPNNGVLLIEQVIDEDKSTVSTSTTNSFQTDTYMNYFMKKNRKNIVEFVDKNYQYKHEYASQSEIYNSNSKYSDKKTFQYALVTSLVKPNQHTRVNTDNGQMSSTHNQPIFKFYLYDRLNDKTYSALGAGSSLIMWAFKSAVKKIIRDK